MLKTKKWAKLRNTDKNRVPAERKFFLPTARFARPPPSSSLRQTKNKSATSVWVIFSLDQKIVNLRSSGARSSSLNETLNILGTTMQGQQWVAPSSSFERFFFRWNKLERKSLFITLLSPKGVLEIDRKACCSAFAFHTWPVFLPALLLLWKIKSFHRNEFERTGSTAERLSGHPDDLHVLTTMVWLGLAGNFWRKANSEPTAAGQNQ